MSGKLILAENRRGTRYDMTEEHFNTYKERDGLKMVKEIIPEKKGKGKSEKVEGAKAAK